MYKLQPIIQLPPISPSKVMYQLPNILGDKVYGSHIEADVDTKMPDDVVTEQKPLRDYSALEARQEKVLDQLAQLKKHVQQLCYFLRQSDRVDNIKIDAPLQKSEKQVKIDLIVHANPWRPPFSILALQKLWKNAVFKLTSHVHCTADEAMPALFPSNSHLVANNVINILLIWKKVDMLEFFIDSDYPLIGEVNFLRYLSRMIEEYNYEKNLRMDDDRVLDLCHCLSMTKRPKDLIMNQLEGIMSTYNSEYEVLPGDCPRLPDIALWSTIRQVFRSDSLHKLPKSIAKMYQVCEQMFIDNNLIHNE